MNEPIYIVTDVECDGGVPGAHSMIAFGSVAITAEGRRFGEFEAAINPLEGAGTDPDVMAWWATQPEALAATRDGARDAAAVMTDFVLWVKSLPAPCIFAAHPMAFDGEWITYYLRRFTPYAVVQGFYDRDKLFTASGLCLRSFAASVLARPVCDCDVRIYPPHWLGDVVHTHRAIDDARGYANLLVKLMALSRATASPLE